MSAEARVYATLDAAIEAARDDLGSDRRLVRRYVTTEERSPWNCDVCATGSACRQEVSEYEGDERLIVHLPGA